MSDTNNFITHRTKLVLLGSTGVGKSSLVLQLMKQYFYENPEPTIGASFFTKTIPLEDYAIKFEIWDTAGQERYNCLIPMYCRGAAVALVVYDITNYDSYKRAKMCIEDLQKSIDPIIVIVLVCNKIDLVKGEIHNKEAKLYAEKKGILFMETSAKDNSAVNDMFIKIAEIVPTTEKKQDMQTIVLSKPEKTKNMFCCY